MKKNITSDKKPVYQKIVPRSFTPPPEPVMNENFLHYIWKLRLLHFYGLSTADGQPLEIIKTGDPNTNAGPDFLNARIKIGSTTWAGNVEIHVHASDWLKHKHGSDPAYQNIILHVVYENDRKIKRVTGELIPTLVLKDRYDQTLFTRYWQLVQNTYWIPCSRQIHHVDKMDIHPWLDRMMVERLQRKSAMILETLAFNNNNWAETFYQHLARNFGFKVNAEPFQALARSLPLSILAKHKDNPFQVEALFFGQAGFLDRDFKDGYPNKMKKEYEYLKSKYTLKPIAAGAVNWKFLRLRPFNFPTIRISQFSALMVRSSALFSMVIESKDVLEIGRQFNVSASRYWDNHFNFDQDTPPKSKALGSGAINNLIINSTIPFIFIYGKQKQIDPLCSKALDFLSKIPGEENEVIDKWKTMNMPVKSAYFTQALLELKNEYCDKKKCLSCSIGNRIIRGSRIIPY